MTVLDRVKIVLEGDTVALTRALQGAEASMRQAGTRMTKIGRTLTTRLTLPLLGVGAASTKVFADFDESMRKIVGLVGISRAQVNAWADDVRRLAVAYGTSAEAAADALFFITSAGLRGAAAMETLEVSLKASAAGLGETQAIADAATSAMNSYAATGLTATRATEILTAGVRKGKLEARALAPVMGRITGMASALNISFEDVVSILGAFSRTGTNAREGATQLVSVMSSLLYTSKEGEQVLLDAGLSLQQLRDIAAKPGGLLEAMRLLDETFEGNKKQLRAVIPNIEALRGVLGLLAQEGEAVDEVFAGVRNSIGIVDEAVTAAEGPALELKRTWQSVKEALLVMGEAISPVVIPALRGIIEVIRSLADWFEELSKAQQRTIVILAGLVTTVGPLLTILGAMLKHASRMINAMSFVKLISGFRLFSGLLLPGGVLLTGLGLLTAAFIKTRLEVSKTKDAIRTATDAMRTAFLAVEPEVAAERAERLTGTIERLQTKVNELRNRASLARTQMVGVADALATQATPATIENADALTAQADRVAETIARMTEFRDLLVTVADTADEASDQDGPVVPPYAAAMREAMKKLEASLRIASGMSELLGDSFDLTTARMKAYRTAIEELVTAGVPLTAVLGEEGRTLRELADMFGLLDWSTQRAREAQEALAEAQAQAAVVTRDVRTPTEVYEAELEKLTGLLEDGHISQEVFNRAVGQAKDTLEAATATTIQWGQELQRITLRSVQDFFSALTQGSNAASEGQQQYNAEVGRLKVLLQEGLITQEAFNTAVYKARDAAGDMSSSFKRMGDVVTNIIGDIIAELQRLAIKMAVMSLFKKLGFEVAGFQHGGFIEQGEVGLVGEAGPELVYGGHGGVTVQPMKSMSFASGSSGGGPNVTVPVHITATDAKSFAELAEANPAAIVSPVLRALHRSELLGRR